ncbi:unnamed protein product [Orchesella dallaii]|uniref:Uncharacterized protein n=1 Tax=Orchesella dallaii TaxID=48710 RepID=A0ABP1R6D5_9HEXA
MPRNIQWGLYSQVDVSIASRKPQRVRLTQKRKRSCKKVVDETSVIQSQKKLKHAYAKEADENHQETKPKSFLDAYLATKVGLFLGVQVALRMCSNNKVRIHDIISYRE